MASKPMDIYLPIAGMSVHALLIVGFGRAGRAVVGHVRSRRGLPDNVHCSSFTAFPTVAVASGHHRSPAHRSAGPMPIEARRGRLSDGAGNDPGGLLGTLAGRDLPPAQDSGQIDL